MTTLCITGNHPLTLSHIAAQLGQAGMAAAQPLQRDPSVTLQVWHQRVCAQSVGVVQPSRLWEQLAVDLMLANLDAPVWGWADTQSHQLLDFWAQLDGDIRFVLLCQTPQQAITHLLTDPTRHCERSVAVHDSSQALADWHSHHQSMLRFHLRHPGQSVMLWADQAQAAPEALVHHLNQRWNLDLTPQDPRHCEEERRGNPAAMDCHAALAETNDSVIASEARQSMSVIASEARQSIFPAPSRHQTTATHAPGRPNAVIQQLVNHIAGLHPELDELDRELHATVTLLIEPSNQEQEEGQGEAMAPTSAIDALIDSYHHLADRSAEQAALQAQADANSKALAQRDTEAKAKTEAITQRDAESKEKTQAQAQLKDAQQEGELLLLQLHQVQEELEKYYLQNQQSQRDVQTHTDRWNRLLKTQPDLCDFDAVELLSDGGEGQPLNWRMNNASLAGRSFNQLDFSMVVEDGVAGFVVRRSASGTSPLLRWPVSAKTEPELTIIPVNGGPSAQRRAAHLVQLCASDWGLMLALPNALIQALQRGHLAIAPARQQTLLKALGRYKHLMDSMQGLVRFDRVSLTGQQSAGQRNVLAIKLDQTRYAKHSLASFAFQLQINKNTAGQPETAHFIFDEKTATAPFQSWASNMLNTAGQPVMAVRLDARGWVDAPQPQLSTDDQSFMSALTDSLAIVLITLQTDGTRTDYPWQDWLKDATLLRQWSRQPRLPVTPVLLPEPSEAPDVPALPTAQVALPAPPTLLALTAKASSKTKPAPKAKPPAPIAKPVLKAKAPAAAKPVVKVKAQPPKAKAPAAAKPAIKAKAKAKPAAKTRRTQGAGN